MDHATETQRYCGCPINKALAHLRISYGANNPEVLLRMAAQPRKVAENRHVTERSTCQRWVLVHKTKHIPFLRVAAIFLETPASLPRCSARTDDDNVGHDFFPAGDGMSS